LVEQYFFFKLKNQAETNLYSGMNNKKILSQFTESLTLIKMTLKILTKELYMYLKVLNDLLILSSLLNYGQEKKAY